MLQYHAAGFRQAGAEILAIADPAPGAARKAADKWGVAHAYESVEALLAERKDVQAVSIIVPNKFHAPLAIQCLNAGKHVFCEKPPALSAEEVRGIQAAAKAAGKDIAVESVACFDVFAGAGLPEGQRSLAFEITLRHAARTLTDAEVTAALDQVAAAAGKAGWTVRR